jgi:hypothetical protein
LISDTFGIRASSPKSIAGEIVVNENVAMAGKLRTAVPVGAFRGEADATDPRAIDGRSACRRTLVSDRIPNWRATNLFTVLIGDENRIVLMPKLRPG